MDERAGGKRSREGTAKASSAPTTVFSEEAHDEVSTGPQGEREKGELQREIREELRRRQLKSELLKELRPKTWKDAWAHSDKHPILITLAGFTLTGLTGGWVAVRYQSRGWDRQQLRLIKYRRIEERYNVIGTLVKAVAARDAALREAEWKLQFRPDTPEDEREQLADHFTQGGRDWDAAVATLRRRILIYFRGPQIIKKFEDFAARRNVTTCPQLLTSIHRGLQAPERERAHGIPTPSRFFVPARRPYKRLSLWWSVRLRTHVEFGGRPDIKFEVQH